MVPWNCLPACLSVCLPADCRPIRRRFEQTSERPHGRLKNRVSKSRRFMCRLTCLRRRMVIFASLRCPVPLLPAGNDDCALPRRLRRQQQQDIIVRLPSETESPQAQEAGTQIRLLCQCRQIHPSIHPSVDRSAGRPAGRGRASIRTSTKRARIPPRRLAGI